MIKLIINNESYFIQFHKPGLELRTTYTTDVPNSGELILHDFKTTPIVDLDQIISSGLKIQISENTILNFDKSQIRHKKNDDYNTLIIAVSDLINIHSLIIKGLSSYQFLSSLRCFNTFSGCNLRCPYCSQDGSDLVHNDDFLLYSHIINDEIRTSNSMNHSCNKESFDRYMGGETLLDYDALLRKINMVRSLFQCGRNTMQIYTNGTVSRNVEKLVSLIDNNILYDNYDIWVTVDTLNHQTSMRYNSKTLLNELCKSLAHLQTLITKHNVNINFNIMFTTQDNVIETCRLLAGMGFKYYKIGFNECDMRDDYKCMTQNISSQLYEKCNKYMTSRKVSSETKFPYHFSIFEFNKCVYMNKYTFDLNYNCIDIFKNNQSIGGVSEFEIWNRFTTGKNE